MMQDISTIQFIDMESGEESLAIIRADKQTIAICLSAKNDDDLEVMMSKKDGKKLLDALRIGLDT